MRTVHVEDGVASPLEMLPILPPERMGDLLARELEAQGFERDGNTCTRTDADGVVISVDLTAATVQVTLGAQAELAESVERTQRTYEERAANAQQQLQHEVNDELEQRIADRTKAIQQAVTAQLEAKLGELKRELDQAIGRATVSALTEKAAQLGNIEETHQDEAGNVTIRVRL